MASVLRGLEADLSSLRKENRDLRASMFVAQQVSPMAQNVSHQLQMSPKPSPQSSPPLPNLLDSLWQEPPQVEPQQTQPAQQLQQQQQQPDEPAPLSARLVQPTAEAAHCQQLDRPQGTESSQLTVPEASPTHERPPRPITDRPGGSLANPQWSLDQSFWLGGVCPTQVPGRVRLLDRESVASVTIALDGLNRGTLRCPEDACIVFSASNQGYFLLYRQGHKTEICNLALKLGAKFVEDAGFQSESPSSGDTQSATPLPPVLLQQTHLQQHAQLMQQQQQQQQLQQQRSLQHCGACSAEGASTSIGAGGGVSLSSGASTPMSRGSPLTGATAADRQGSAATISTTVGPSGVATPTPYGKATETCKDPLHSLLELASNGEAEKAEEVLWQALRSGAQTVSAACYDAVICAFEQKDDNAKAEEWLARAVQCGLVPSEASFNVVILAACLEGNSQKVEDIMSQMIRNGVRPCKELFNVVIRMFAEQRNPHKVEEWLLKAGNMRWTPDQSAFEAAVALYAEVDPGKSEEWLSRSQQTDYRLSDACFNAVVSAHLNHGRADKASDWLSRMLEDGRLPSDVLVREAVTRLATSGDLGRAEAWLSRLADTGGSSRDDMRKVLFDAALQVGEMACAVRQLQALGSVDPGRTLLANSALIERGEAAWGHSVLQDFCNSGGVATSEILSAILVGCAATGDADESERAARKLVESQPLKDAEVLLLQQAMGEERAATLLEELGADTGLLPATSETVPHSNRLLPATSESVPWEKSRAQQVKGRTAEIAKHFEKGTGQARTAQSKAAARPPPQSVGAAGARHGPVRQSPGSRRMSPGR